MSATPEEIAERLDRYAAEARETGNAHAESGDPAAALCWQQEGHDLRTAAALIRAQSARIAELERALKHLLRHSGIADVDPRDKDQEDQDVERAARAALKGTQP